VDGTGSGSCPMADFGISGAEPSDSVTTVSIRQIIEEQVVRMGGAWNWLRIVPNSSKIMRLAGHMAHTVKMRNT